MGDGCVGSLTEPQGNLAQYPRLCEGFSRYVYTYAESGSDCLMMQEMVVTQIRM